MSATLERSFGCVEPTQAKPTPGRPLMPNQATVYRLLSDAAARGQYCPKNDELADALGAASAATPGNILRRLQDWQLIRVETEGRHRRVHIIETGQVTR